MPTPPPAQIWVDGSLVPSTAGLSYADHGFTTGDGAFETLRIVRRTAFAVTRHLARLRLSLSALGIEAPDEPLLRSGIEAVVASSNLDNGRLRITVTAGDAPPGSLRGGGRPTIVIASASPPHVDDAVRVVRCPWTRNESGALAGVKSTSYAENVLALRYATMHDAGEAIFVNTRDELCEGSGTNVFVVIGGRLATPPLSSGCLAGVTRGLVLELMRADERPMPYSALTGANEAFLTSTTRDVQPIAVVDGRSLSLAPGPVTMDAMKLFATLVADNLDP